MFVPGKPRFTENELRLAIESSKSWNETLRRLRYRSQGGNAATIKKYARTWGIPTGHFDPHAASVAGLRRYHKKAIPLENILVAGSKYNRAHLKTRLFEAGLKERCCELCGQDENWNGSRMALILDHINGIPDDNRLENLRIACPNCAATFPTHCGRANKTPPRDCPGCGAQFQPPYEQLLREIAETSTSAVARRYGVTFPAIKNWIRFYERQRHLAEEFDDAA